MQIKRAITEFLSPKLKCERMGHRLRDHYFLIREERFKNPCDKYENGVAIERKAILSRCRRCGHEVVKHRERYGSSIHSLSMPDYMWAELKEKGYLKLDRISSFTPQELE